MKKNSFNYNFHFVNTKDSFEDILKMHFIRYLKNVRKSEKDEI